MKLALKAMTCPLSASSAESIHEALRLVIEVSAQMTFCPSGLIDLNHTTISVISSQHPHHTLLYSFSGTVHCFQNCSHCLQKVSGKPGSHESSMLRVKNVKTLKKKSQDLLIANRRHSLVSSVKG